MPIDNNAFESRSRMCLPGQDCRCRNRDFIGQSRSSSKQLEDCFVVVFFGNEERRLVVVTEQLIG